LSLRNNIIANYVSQFYVTLIGIIMLPMYVKYMGTEAYGLIGFYAMLQAWFTLLDMGLTPAMAREASRFKGGAVDGLSLRRLLRALEGIFIGIAFLGAIAMMGSSRFFASSWLKVQHLPLDQVQYAILLMGAIVALRWVSGLYRSAISGFERLVWLSGFNIGVATARFVVVIPFLIFVDASPSSFFIYQLLLAIVEIAVLVSQTYRLMPVMDSNQPIGWRWQPLHGVLKFSLTIAFTGAVWVLVTQTDKLVLSGLIPLTEYAYFTLGVLVASGITIISGPISGPLLPRLTRLNAEADEAGVIQLYRTATQMVAVVAIPASLVLAIFAEQVLWAWTGDVNIAKKAAPVLTLYAIGNGLFTLAAFPYYLQFAKGDLKLHLIGNILFLLIYIPLLVLATRWYGAVGAGYAWIFANGFPFVVWLPIVHRRFGRDLHKLWLINDILPILLYSTSMAAVLYKFVSWPSSQFMTAVYVGIVSAVMCLAAASGSSWARGAVSGRRRTSINQSL
jgi:O-antigen/teichoic acid export membrane protein